MTATGMSDEDIREMARARVSFRIHVIVYVAVNLLLIAIWWLTSGPRDEAAGDGSGYWPLWAHVGWGIGLAFPGFGAYGSFNQWQRREEEKLRAQHGRQR